MKSATDQPEVSLEKFVTVNVKMQQEGKGVKEIADALGLKREYVAQRRTQLRNQGIALPKLSKGGGGRTRLDIAGAQALLASLTGQNIDEVKKAGAELVEAASKRGKSDE